MGLGIVLLAALVATVVTMWLLLAGVSIGVALVAYPVTGVLLIIVVQLLPYLKDHSNEP
jgi:hypothetical protein